MHRAANSVRVDATREAGQGPRVRIQGQPAVFSASGVHLKAGVPSRDFGDRVGVLMETERPRVARAKVGGVVDLVFRKDHRPSAPRHRLGLAPPQGGTVAVKTQTSDERYATRCLGSLALLDEASVLFERTHDRSRPTSLMGRH